MKIYAKVALDSYDEWVKNFALNLPDIWNDSSAAKLKPTMINVDFKTTKSAIVIGRGPSLKKNKHLELWQIAIMMDL